MVGTVTWFSTLTPFMAESSTSSTTGWLVIIYSIESIFGLSTSIISCRAALIADRSQVWHLTSLQGSPHRWQVPRQTPDKFTGQPSSLTGPKTDTWQVYRAALIADRSQVWHLTSLQGSPHRWHVPRQTPDKFTCFHIETDTGDHHFCLNWLHYHGIAPTRREWVPRGGIEWLDWYR